MGQNVNFKNVQNCLIRNQSKISTVTHIATVRNNFYLISHVPNTGQNVNRTKSGRTKCHPLGPIVISKKFFSIMLLIKLSFKIS